MGKMAGFGSQGQSGKTPKKPEETGKTKVHA
jgi:hypothetical protein